MNAELELERLVNENYEVTMELLWSKVYNFHRYFNDIANLATDKKNVKIISKYLRNINKDEPNYRQFITVKNESIDIVLRRYMLEAIDLNITVDFDVDPLGNLSAESAVQLIQTLAECFSKTFHCRNNLRLFLTIKNEQNSILISIDRNTHERIFDEKVEK